ncbi:MAG: hypothetical protein WAU17_16640 [Nitrospirales bacterium]
MKAEFQVSLTGSLPCDHDPQYSSATVDNRRSIAFKVWQGDIMKAIMVLAILVGFFVECSSAYSNVDPAANDIWVSISFQRGPENDNPAGLLAKSVFDDVTSGLIRDGWLELRQVHWQANGRLVPLRVAGAAWGYGDRYIFRIESINRIIPLSAEAIAHIEQGNLPEPSGTMHSRAAEPMDLLDIIAGILLVVFSIWATWYLYWDVKRRWSKPEE